MNNVNKTLYIPLFGKAYVSKKRIILRDDAAEKIWKGAAFPLRGKAKSKWLAYYMGMRARVFDDWVSEAMGAFPEAVVLHIGCGLDSRALRVGCAGCSWYDVDFPEVIEERKKHYSESDNYKMIAVDARRCDWLDSIPADKCAIIVMEGISMYLKHGELSSLLENIGKRFEKVKLLADFYTVFAAKASKYRNPINSVGVTEVYGTDDPTSVARGTGLSFVGEREMTPDALIDSLVGMERRIFKSVYGGKLSKKLYRLCEYEK